MGNNPFLNTDLTRLLNILKDEIKIEINCHAIARVEDFDDARLTVKASMFYPKTINGKTVPHPVLADCPLYIASGGGARLTFPIAQGDACLIAFNDRDLDNWFASGQYKTLNTPRVHAFADGVALVGLNSLADQAKNSAAYGAYDTARAVLAYGRNQIAVGPAGVKIANLTTTLGIQIGDLMLALDAFATTAGSATTATQIAAAAATLQAALIPIQTALGGLIE